MSDIDFSQFKKGDLVEVTARLQGDMSNDMDIALDVAEVLAVEKLPEPPTVEELQAQVKKLLDENDELHDRNETQYETIFEYQAENKKLKAEKFEAEKKALQAKMLGLAERACDYRNFKLPYPTLQDYGL